MALKSTVFKAELQIADMDRHHYGNHALTIARHPSETDERMMVRIVAFALYADELLAFGRGLGEEDEPALCIKDLTGAMRLWIHVGLPDEKLIRKSCGRAEDVVVVCYGGSAADIWWEKNRSELERLDNLTVLNLALPESKALAGMVKRNMPLQATLQDGAALFSGEGQSTDLHPQRFKAAAGVH
jgi:uncharacterized protein YaeQ